MDAPIEGLTLNCPTDGEQKWSGDVFCKACNTIYLCSGAEFTTNEIGEQKAKYIYPDAPPKGVCQCGKRLFGGTDFTARPMCHLCAVRVTTRKAAERGEILWKEDDRAGMDKTDRADPRGDGSYDLGVWEHPDGKFMWEVGYPSGHCAGAGETREQARKSAERIYAALAKLEEENAG